MPRTSNATIIEWGTPPEPAPTGWDAVRIALDGKPGEWANVGDFTKASARKTATERFTGDYETRVVPREDGRADLWVRRVAAAAAENPSEPVETDDTASAPAPRKR